MMTFDRIPALSPVLSGAAVDTLSVTGDLYATFARYAASRPELIAIYRDNLAITYGELAARISQVDTLLHGFNVQAQDRVGIQIARSPAFVVAVFAVIAVGGVFVPLSEDEPEIRIKSICSNAGVTVLLRMNPERTEVIGERVSTRTLAACPGSPNVAKELSYILHTSGSTGLPKGVAVSKAALLNCLSWHVDLFSIGENTTVSHLNLTSFDFIIAEVLLPFVRGGSMAIPSAAVATDVIGIVEALASASVSVIQMVPTLMGRFLRALAASSELRNQLNVFAQEGRMICNGEALPDSMRRLFYRLFPKALLYNCYGPTEACVAITKYLCPTDDAPKTIYIGKPVPNAALYVVDDKLMTVETGSVGELLIGGVQVAEGYVGDPSTTSAKFIPVSTDGSVRIVYRTGDQVRVTSEGLVEFVGRNDDQVKYRSLRLELGEIESITQRSGLCDDARALVTNSAESGGRQELILFVSPRTVPLRALEHFLVSELPKDRTPTRIVALEQMPMTDRGKLDRTRLIEFVKSPRNGMLLVQDRISDKVRSESYRLTCLLESIREVTGRDYLSEDLWPVAGMDSLALMDLELSLLERGLKFVEHAYEKHGVMLRTLAEELENAGSEQHSS